MRGERGITYTALIIYVIALIIVVGLISSFSSYFFRNTDEIAIESNAQEQYTRFLAYFTKDVNREDIKNVIIKNENNSLTFEFNGGELHEYVLNDEKITYKQFKDSNLSKNIILCSNVSTKENGIFEYEFPQIEVFFYVENEKFSNTFNI